jgi:hypothetical protein
MEAILRQKTDDNINKQRIGLQQFGYYDKIYRKIKQVTIAIVLKLNLFPITNLYNKDSILQ